MNELFTSTAAQALKEAYADAAGPEAGDAPSPWLKLADMRAGKIIGRSVVTNSVDYNFTFTPPAVGWAGCYQWNEAMGCWVKQPETKACGPVCECGVKFTGGLHSDWCPCHG